MSTESSLLISFPDQSPAFCYGYEAGIIWGKMEMGIPDLHVTIHESNIGLIKTMAQKCENKYTFIIKKYRDFEYADCVLIKSTIGLN